MKNRLDDVLDRASLRLWFESYHTEETECWVRTSMKPTSGALYYLDVVEEALCFGWIDSTKKRIDDVSYQRLSPRRKNSSWTQLNIQRVLRLQRMGMMTAFGLSIVPPEALDFKIDADILMRIKEDPIVYENFQNMHPLYQKVRLDTIQSVRKDPVHFNKRLDRFIEQTRNNIMYGQWNDNGRLLDD
ncbi:hypothetical protein AOC36_06305 [Erysipelothrix larvae]|uniref:Thymidylate synthase n=1 Tax=Erysipelothrix larvae TaxID=1514105 RepID=A0A0X8H028_9FIRM|nr:YdeI/OmpD-associated family protein [Erysipelothrix larvae]AMC93610.1 hypothetical protein AOC36_06305 [Erysipelothrix larvae]